MCEGLVDLLFFTLMLLIFMLGFAFAGNNIFGQETEEYVTPGNAFVTLQRRPWPGVRNYGEVIGFRNRADGDRWDVLVPGMKDELPYDEPYRLQKVLGVVLIKGGNHKMVVELAPPHTPVSKERADADIRAFVRVYARVHPGISAARIRYLALDEFDFM